MSGEEVGEGGRVEVWCSNEVDMQGRCGGAWVHEVKMLPHAWIHNSLDAWSLEGQKSLRMSRLSILHRLLVFFYSVRKTWQKWWLAWSAPHAPPWVM